MPRFVLSRIAIHQKIPANHRKVRKRITPATTIKVIKATMMLRMDNKNYNLTDGIIWKIE